MYISLHDQGIGVFKIYKVLVNFDKPIGESVVIIHQYFQMFDINERAF